MTKKTVALIAVAVVLAAVYVTAFTDWFNRPQIQILPQIRPPTRATRGVTGDNAVYPVLFAFDKKYELTEVRVVVAADAKTNKYPHTVWHLISDSNSIPIKAVAYGVPIKGMKPKVPRAQPEVLAPDVVYTLFVKAGKLEGQTNFQTREIVRPGTE